MRFLECVGCVLKWVLGVGVLGALVGVVVAHVLLARYPIPPNAMQDLAVAGTYSYLAFIAFCIGAMVGLVIGLRKLPE
jgi:tetrahydromethanopterin S-methyltransferase subunit C